MSKFIVEITAPNGGRVDLDEAVEIVMEGITDVFGWRAFKNGFTYSVKRDES